MIGFILGMLGILLLVIVGKVLRISLKVIKTLVVNGLVGVVTLFIVNLVAGLFHYNVEITPLAAVLTGFFGMPFVLLYFLYTFM